MSKKLTLCSVALAATVCVGGCGSTGFDQTHWSPEAPRVPLTAMPAETDPTGSSSMVVPVAFSEIEIESDDPVSHPTSRIQAQPIAFAKLISEADFDDDAALKVDDQSDLTSDATDLAELEAIAQTSHPELQQAQARISQARGKANQAGLPYNPVLQYQSDEIGNADTSGLHSVAISQQFVTANKLGIAQQQQLQVVQQRLAQYELARLRVLTRVRTAYAEMLIAQDRTVITRSIADLAQRSADTVKSLLEAEEVSRIAFLQARVEAERAKLVSQNAIATLDQKRRTLAAAVGVPSLPHQTVRGKSPVNLSAKPWQELSDEIAALSPQIASAGASLQQARWALQLACAQVTPNVTGQLGIGYDAGTDDTYATIGVSVPLPIRNRNQGNIRAAQASIAAASANIDRTELALRQALADAVGRYEVARQTYQQLRQEISPDAEEAFNLARTAFESGEADFLQVLTAQRTWFDTRLAAINALQTAKTADAEIQGALTLSIQQ